MFHSLNIGEVLGACLNLNVYFSYLEMTEQSHFIPV